MQLHDSKLPDVYVICGPTASGKSGVALDWAQEHGATILNADSMQIYHDLPVLTAQPDASERATVPHLLYGIRDSWNPCDAAQWRDLAFDAIAKTHASGGMPLLVGGTGLYLEALLFGLSPIPPVDDSSRDIARAECTSLGAEGLRPLVAQHDPAAAARIKPNDAQRLTRAREVWLATGQSLSAWQALPLIPAPYPCRFHVTILNPAWDFLNPRIRTRLDKMVTGGGLAELENFMTHPDWRSSPLARAVTIPEFAAYILGETSRTSALELAFYSTRHYAKRQKTWFSGRLATKINSPGININMLHDLPDIAGIFPGFMPKIAAKK